jgi:predicted MFS family arabinose efflux permease
MPRAALPRSVAAVSANLAEGLHYVLHARHVLVALVTVGLVNTAGMNFQVLIPPLARDVLAAGPSGFGFLLAAAGLGSITSALVLAFRGRPRLRAILAAGLLLGIFEVGLSTSRSMPLSLAIMFAVGLASVAMTMNANTLIQITVPDHLRGRVMAVYVTVFVGSTPVGGLIFGAIAGAFGTATALLIGGLASAAVSAVAAIIAWRWGLLRSGPRVNAVQATPTLIEPDDVQP